MDSISKNLRHLACSLPLILLVSCQSRATDRMVIQVSRGDGSFFYQILDPRHPAKARELDLACEDPLWSPFRDIVACSTPTREIRIFDGRDGSVRGIIPGTGNTWSPSDWSPDGRSLAISGLVNRNYEVFVARTVDGQNWSLTQLTFDPVMEDISSRWSPDGNLILIHSETASDGLPDCPLYWCDILKIVTPEGVVVLRFRLDTIDGYEGGPSTVASWSSDGNQLGLMGWHLIDIHNGHVTDLLPEQAGRLCTDFPPEWSPNGKVLLFQAEDCENRGPGNHRMYIFTVNVDGSSLRKLSEGAYTNRSQPSWTSDGNSIVFDRYENGNWQVFIMNSDGTNLRSLTDIDEDAYFLQWLPPNR